MNLVQGLSLCSNVQSVLRHFARCVGCCRSLGCLALSIDQCVSVVSPIARGLECGLGRGRRGVNWMFRCCRQILDLRLCRAGTQSDLELAGIGDASAGASQMGLVIVLRGLRDGFGAVPLSRRWARKQGESRCCMRFARDGWVAWLRTLCPM